MRKQTSISAIAAMLLLAVFSLSILGILLGGAQVYRNLTSQGAADYNRRTCLQFLSTKLKQAQTPDSVDIRQFGDGDALFILERYGSRTYVTRIYCHNGWLMELFSLDDAGFSPEDGEKILPLDSLKVTEKEGLLTLQAVSGEDIWQLYHATEGGRYEE